MQNPIDIRFADRAAQHERTLGIGRLLACIPTATLYEAIGKHGELGPEIRLMTPGTALMGVAYTVQTFLGQTRSVLEAIAEAPAGSVLAIDCGGTAFASAWGGTSSRAALKRGIAGCVTNGSVRDVAELRALGLPVFAAGINLRGTLKDKVGNRQVSVSIGTCSIEPGDLIIGDEDGVVAIPYRLLDQIINLAQRRVELEASVEAQVEAGVSILVALGLKADSQ